MAHSAHEIISRNSAEILSRDIDAFCSSSLRCFKEAVLFLMKGFVLKRDLFIPISAFNSLPSLSYFVFANHTFDAA